MAVKKKNNQDITTAVERGQEIAAQQIANQDITTAVERGQGPSEEVKTSSSASSKTTNNSLTPEVFRDSKTGELSGITIGGKTFLGLSPQEVRDLSNRYLEKRTLPEGAISVAEAANLRRAQEASSQIGVLPTRLEQLQEANTDWGQALTAGTVKAAPSILKNLGTGAIGGALVGGGVGAVGGGVGAVPGAIIGGAIGAIASIWTGIQSNLESQKKGVINAEIDVLTNAKTNMRQLAMLASQNPSSAGDYVQSFNYQLALVQRAHSQIKVETQGNLNKYIEDGTDILSDFELFLGPSGTAEIYGEKLRVALQSGQPLTLADFDSEELAGMGL